MYNHALADQRLTGEVELIACATPGVLDTSMCEVWCDVDTSIAIRQSVVDGPWLLVGALKRTTAVATSTGGDIRRLVVGRTRFYWSRELCLPIPTTRRFATVPEASRNSLSSVVEMCTSRKDREELDSEGDIAEMLRHHCGMRDVKSK